MCCGSTGEPLRTAQDGLRPRSGCAGTHPGVWLQGKGDPACVSLLRPWEGTEPQHPACSRAWSQDSGRALTRSCHPGTACPLPWRALLCPGPSLWPCPARTGETGTGDGPRVPGAPSSVCGCGGWTSLCTLGVAPPSLPLVTSVLSRVPGARRVRRSPGDWGGCPGKQSRGQAWALPPRRPNLPRPPGRAVRGQPHPPEPPGGTWGPGAHKYRQGQSPPLLLRSESCSGGDPPPRGVAMGAGVEK